MKKLSRKEYVVKGFGFIYAKAISDEMDIIWGGSLVFLDKKILTISIADSVWTDDAGKPFKFKKVGHVLYIHKIAIGLD